ncbi:MAG TPA: hypothetical protein PK314_14855 [Deltaproteobacteria bacterium]|nr:hypothetical protein [Deltaproteobacteria bacterium]
MIELDGAVLTLSSKSMPSEILAEMKCSFLDERMASRYFSILARTCWEGLQP